MIFFISLLPALLALTASGGINSAQVSTSFVQNEFVTRVPVLPSPTVRFVWEEVDGPNCIAAKHVRGALLSDSEHVDFVMGSNRRFRAKFDSDCPALDFYEGFYVNSPNRMICAGRDEIRSRMGGSCSIESFTQLVPVRRVRVP
jgi:hypothetical protein